MIYLCLKAHSLIVNAFLIRSNLKTIVFKLNQFPHLSETFITSQIILAIKFGFDVKLLVAEVLSFKASKQTKLLEKYNIADKIIIEDYNIPKNKIHRFLKWGYLLIKNINNLNYIIRFYKHQNSFSLTWLFQLVFYKNHAKVSIFHIQYGTNKSPVDILKKIDFIKASLVVSFHGHDAFFPINGFIPNNGYYNNLFSGNNKIIANTPYLAEVILELGCPKSNINTIPLPVDVDFFFPLKNKVVDTDTVELITVGRLSHVKGQVYAFQALKKLLDLNYKVSLTVVGEGNEWEKLERFIEENNLKDSVKLVGSKSQSEVRDFLRNSDIFLFTSVATNEGRRETQGLATLEAQACGLPVVVFDSGGVKFTVKDGETGFLVPEYDTEAMTSGIIELIENDKLRKKMSKQAVQFVNEVYSQKGIDVTWKYLYESLSNGK